MSCSSSIDLYVCVQDGETPLLAMLEARRVKGESTLLETVKLLADKEAFLDAVGKARAHHCSCRVVLFAFAVSIQHDGNGDDLQNHNIGMV